MSTYASSSAGSSESIVKFRVQEEECTERPLHPPSKATLDAMAEMETLRPCPAGASGSDAGNTGHLIEKGDGITAGKPCCLQVPGRGRNCGWLRWSGKAPWRRCCLDFFPLFFLLLFRLLLIDFIS